MLGMNRNQWLGIMVVVVGALLVSKSQLDILVGQSFADKIVAFCAVANLVLGGIVTKITSQEGMAKQLSNLPGVSVEITKTADPSMAKLALDPKLENISPAPGQDAAVTKKANE